MIAILMGVSGSGKSAVGRRLAERLEWRFYDGDDFHSPASVAKMARGEPLTDADRAPWLDRLAALVREVLARGDNAVLACSALKAAYRSRLLIDPAVVLVYLKGDYPLLVERVRRRRGHFMPAALLKTQFETLEEPDKAIRADAVLPVDAVVDQLEKKLRSLDSPNDNREDRRNRRGRS